MAKILVLSPILAHLIQIRAVNLFFFFKIWPCKYLDIMLLSLCTISEKTKDPISGKLSDGRNGRKDRRTDGRE